ncbi:MAG: LysR family transcriptional regulator [Myxococcota bacterium]
MHQDPRLFDDLDLNDLRVVVAIAEAGTLRAAAGHLGLSHTTVARRLSTLQERLGARVFEREGGRWIPNAVGQLVIDAARVVQREVTGLERTVLGHDQRLSGRIRISAPDLLVTHLLMPDFVDFARRYPALDLELSSTYDLVDLGGRQADLAVRLRAVGTSPREELVGRRVAVVHQGVYASRRWLADHDPRQPGEHTTWTGWVGDDHPELPSWVRASPFPRLRTRHALEGAALQIAAARAGLGLAVLPCLMGDPDPDLVRIPGVATWPRWDLWVLVHPDLRHTTRLAVVRQFLVDAVTRFRSRLDGTEGSHATS